MALNYIYIGSTTEPSFFFTNEQITRLNANISVDAVGNELAIDTLEFEVTFDDEDGTLRALGYGTPIFYYDSQHFVGKFYFKSISRVGSHLYTIYAVSVIGLMEFEKHYGGYYQNRNLKNAVFETFVSDGLRTNVFTEYVLLAPGAQNVQLADNYLGSSVNASGTNTAIYVAFDVASFPSQGSDAIYYVHARDKTSSGGEYYVGIFVDNSHCTVYCSIGETAINRAYFAISRGQLVEVQIEPAGGVVGYRIDKGSWNVSRFTALEKLNVIMPLYGLRGCADYTKYSDGEIVIENIIPDVAGTYHLYCLEFFQSAWIITDYMLLYGMKNYFTDQRFLRDVVSGKSYYNTTNFIPGGDVQNVEGNFGDVITADDLSSELANIANNIQWDSGIQNLTFTGWIPSGTKREVLHQILFALNLNMYKDENGNLIIGKLPSELEGSIPASEIYNSGSVENVKQPKRIELTEHYYGTPTASASEVFDNSTGTTPSGTYIVDLNNAPIYGNATGTSGLTVISNNANAAIVSGKGKILAQSYIHSKRVITADISTRPDGDTVSVSNATLVTYINSTSVMNKLKAYYANAVYKIKNAIIGNGRKTGRKFELLTPFSEEDEAYLMSAKITGSSTTKYDCEFISGFTPVQAGNTYNNFVVLTGSGTWTKPSGVTRIFVVLVGGGQGGSSGLAGEDGKRLERFVTVGVAKGGAYGANGSGGKVKEVSIESASASYEYSCGTGGAGGAICTDKETPNDGSLGGDTTFGSYSSASGETTTDGYTNILTGDVLARSMPVWNSESGKGGNGGYTTVGNNRLYKDTVQHKPEEAYNFLTGVTYTGGRSGNMKAWGGINVSGGEDTRTVAQIGGGGGGAALDENGHPAIKGNPATTDPTKRDELLVGGDGADATFIPPKATDYNPKYYGYGGIGGAGGGGGGQGGGYENTWSESSSFIVGYGGGLGGYGGQGGDGGDGCVVVFY